MSAPEISTPSIISLEIGLVALEIGSSSTPTAASTTVAPEIGGSSSSTAAGYRCGADGIPVVFGADGRLRQQARPFYGPSDGSDSEEGKVVKEGKVTKEDPDYDPATENGDDDDEDEDGVEEEADEDNVALEAAAREAAAREAAAARAAAAVQEEAAAAARATAAAAARATAAAAARGAAAAELQVGPARVHHLIHNVECPGCGKRRAFKIGYWTSNEIFRSRFQCGGCSLEWSQNSHEG